MLHLQKPNHKMAEAWCIGSPLEEKLDVKEKSHSFNLKTSIIHHHNI
jgi:hypothetical protein